MTSSVRITDIRAIGLRGATPKGGWTHEIEPDDVVHTLVEVRTDAGLTGYGSVYTDARLVRAALGLLEPFYAGENALEPERVSDKLHRNTFWQGRGGAVTHAISGIDIALWDILGRAVGQPVGRLLGGRHRSRVMPYASVLITDPGPLADVLARVRDAGFRAVKIGWGGFGRRGRRYDEDVVRTARETLGDDALLAVDAGGSDGHWTGDYTWAVRTADMLAHHEVAWFEEPLSPDAFDDFVALRRRSPVHIAGGEALTRRQSLQRHIAAGAFDIVQPDVTKVGGISEQRRIGWSAEDHGIRLVGHGWNTAVGLAADLQVASALTRTDLVEYITGSPYIDDLVVTPWRLDADGMLAIPESPGLGIELDPDVLAKYSDEP